jgi:Fic family protein
LRVDKRRARPAEQGIAEMMVDLYRRFAEPLSGQMLFDWHRMLVQGRRDLSDIGRYRRGKDPMEVVSGAIYAPKVHFQAPPSSAVPSEMKGFVKWFNHTAPNGKTPLPSLSRAGLAHLYFVSIHPFEDGNGRIARSISEKALAQGLGQPTLNRAGRHDPGQTQGLLRGAGNGDQGQRNHGLACMVCGDRG